MNKLSRKDIAMLEVLAVTEESKGKLVEYIQQREKAAKAYKTFREAVVNGVEVEKVVESVEPKRKFKVGDKAQVLCTGYPLARQASLLRVGEEGTVVGYKADGLSQNTKGSMHLVVVESKESGELSYFYEEALKLVEEKSPNELSAEVIEKAKEFVSDTSNYYIFDANFIINTNKRTVVVLLKGVSTKKVYSKGIAKCNPSDVFNEHIGKAIALGRALGKDVSEFENAVQPDEVVIGHVVKGDEASGLYSQEHKFTLTSKRGRDAFYYAESEEDFIYNWQIGDIIDDTNAIYGEGSK